MGDNGYGPNIYIRFWKLKSVTVSNGKKRWKESKYFENLYDHHVLFKGRDTLPITKETNHEYTYTSSEFNLNKLSKISFYIFTYTEKTCLKRLA